MTDSLIPVGLLLIDRYLAGECTPEENQHIARWAAADPAHQSQLAAAREIRQRTALPVERNDIGSAWRSVAGQLNPPVSTASRGKTRPLPKAAVGRHLITPFIWSLATVGVVIGIALWIWHASGTRVDSYVSSYATGIGERRALRLPDGTALTLGPASQIRVARQYGRPTRELQLTGEAYFSVVHDPQHPFVVRTSNTIVKDIGTTSDVKAYANDDKERITVATGTVAVSQVVCPLANAPTACVATLGAGDLAVLSANGVSVTPGVAANTYMAWMQGELVFDSVPLRDVAHDLERTFGVAIAFSDSTLGQRSVTGDFAQLPIDEILRELGRVLDVQFVHHGHSVVVSRPADNGAVKKSPLPMTTVLRTPATS